MMQRIQGNLHEIDIFRRSVTDFPETASIINLSAHGESFIRSRTGQRISQVIREKIQRKSSSGNPITPEKIFNRITDIAGVRVLHLYQSQFSEIRCVITKKLG